MVQKQLNQALGSLRIVVKHAFFLGGGRLKIIKQKIYLKSVKTRERVMRIAVDLHNLRMFCQKSLGVNSG